MSVAGFIIGLFCLLFGAVMAFAGYRLFRFLLPVWGFVAGFWISEVLVAALLGDSNTAVIIGWVAGFVGGLILAAVSYFLFKLAVAILAATVGLWLTTLILTAIGLESAWLVAILAVAIAAVLAILAMRGNLDRPIVIVATAILGASFITGGLLFLIGDLTLDAFRSGQSVLDIVIDSTPFWLFFWAGAAAVGAFVQWQVTGPAPEAQAAGEEAETEVWDSQVTIPADTAFWDDEPVDSWNTPAAQGDFGTTAVYRDDDST